MASPPATFNACEALLAQAARLPDKVAILHHTAAGDLVPVTYRQLARFVDQAAQVFVQRGLRPGERVVLLLNDSPLYCAALLGVIKAGGVAIPLNTRLSARDYAHVCADSRASLAVADAGFMAMLGGVRSPSDSFQLIQASDFERMCSAMPGSFAAAPTSARDPAFWLYSSGTTGRPKAVVHSHANCALSGKLLREVLGTDERCVVLSTSKLFFAYALDNALLGPIRLGATTVISEAWPQPETVAALVARVRPGVFFSVPSFFRQLLALGEAPLRPFSAVRFLYTGGERLPDTIAAQWARVAGRPVGDCYGMSETYCNAIANFPGRERMGSCGELLDGVEARLLDRGGGGAVHGEPGILWLRHPCLALRYNDEEQTARFFREGWFCTNDLFTVDADGYYWHRGRADDLIKVAGQWVNPGEVEDAALKEPAVREAACVVVPDDQGFERLALFVVAARSPEEVLGAVSRSLQSQLPRHSQPKWIREIEELPRTPTGKVQRFKLRGLLLEELSSSAGERCGAPRAASN